jgi:2-amino-4-hydroxy-6-hydroxymethyldihydropteridine diphosphokinase
MENQNFFINAVAEIKTTLSARDLLQKLQNIEDDMGRKRVVKGGPRMIDLDLLFYGQNVIEDHDLTVPHPEIQKRRFVLEPLCEIASYFIHPSFGVSICGLKDRLSDNKIVEIIKE